MEPRYAESIAPQTLRTFLLFLYATGASVDELMALRASEIQWQHPSVVIRHNRYNAARNIPLCPNLMTALEKYHRWKLRQGLEHEFFFLKNDSKQLARGSLTLTFRRLCVSVHMRRPDGGQATMKDLRPTFAVHRIKSWRRGRTDLNRLLPALSVYMGHGGLYAAQKYLTMTPERFRSQLNKLTSVRRKGRWKENRELIAFLGSLN